MRELAVYRLERADEMLKASEENLNLGQLRTSLNCSYYAVFHAMRAVNALESFDSSKHSGVIAFFNKTYLKANKIDRKFVAIIKETSYLREKSDYDDFYTRKKYAVQYAYHGKMFKKAKLLYPEIRNRMISTEGKEAVRIYCQFPALTYYFYRVCYYCKRFFFFF